MLQKFILAILWDLINFLYEYLFEYLTNQCMIRWLCDQIRFTY